MTALESWLKDATRCLSQASAMQVRGEIQEHYEASRETAIHEGKAGEEAEWAAVAALGSAQVANRQYRKVLLTKSEARVLRQGQWEAKAVCSRWWMKWVMRAIPAAMLLAAAWLFVAGDAATARILLGGGIGAGVLFAAPFLPVYTPARARVYRAVKWVVVLALLAWVFGPGWLKMSWLLMVCLWQMAWIEMIKGSIRRKLPVGAWPKHLYL